MKETLSPQERIRKKEDFSRLYTQGRRYHGKYIILIYLSNSVDLSRMSAVVSKKHGNAVRRNRIKRQIRALFRMNKALLTKPHDLLVIPRKSILETPWSTLAADFKAALNSISGN